MTRLRRTVRSVWIGMTAYGIAADSPLQYWTGAFVLACFFGLELAYEDFLYRNRPRGRP